MTSVRLSQACPEQYACMLECLADWVEERGQSGADLDPGETADSLREQAMIARFG